MEFLERLAGRVEGEGEGEGERDDDGKGSTTTKKCEHAAFMAYVEETQRATRAFAKRQFTWFRGEKEGRFWWLDVSLAETPEKLTRAVLDLFELGPPPSAKSSPLAPGFEAASFGNEALSARRWDPEAAARLFSLTDEARGATDGETARELKRYVPRQTVFVDPVASRDARRQVDVLVETVRRKARERKRADE